MKREEEMEKKWHFLSMLFLMALGFSIPFPVRPQDESGIDKLELVQPRAVSVSVEHYQQRNGWTPIVLTVSELELTFFLNGSGEVSREPERVMKLRRPLFWVDLTGSFMKLDEHIFSMQAYEQNAVRSRYRIAGAELKVELMIEKESGRCDLYAGRVLLSRGWLLKDENSAWPGEKVYRLTGPEMQCQQRFIFRQARGEMLTLPRGKQPRPGMRLLLWARKSSRG